VCAVLLMCCRGLAAHSTPAEETELKPATQDKPLQEPKSNEQPGWFSRFYRDNMIDTGHEQHSSRLSAKDTVYELQCNYWISICILQLLIALAVCDICNLLSLYNTIQYGRITCTQS